MTPEHEAHAIPSLIKKISDKKYLLLLILAVVAYLTPVPIEIT